MSKRSIWTRACCPAGMAGSANGVFQACPALPDTNARTAPALDDAELPLMVFGPLGLLRPGPIVTVQDLRVPLPRPAGLMVEKLLTDRTGEKGARDLLVVAGLLAVAGRDDLDEFVTLAGSLGPVDRHAVVSALTVLSLMERRPAMPDPSSVRRAIAELLARLDAMP